MKRRPMLVPLVALLLFGLGLPGAGAHTPVSDLHSDRWIAYQMDDRVRLVQPNGSNEHLLTPDWTGGPQYHPDWSPDASQIVFSADEEDGTRDIWIANVDGSGAEKLLDCADPCIALDDPDVSADGLRIAYTQFASDNGTTDGSVRILALADGSITTAFDADPGDTPGVPSWSPDGQRLVFVILRWAEPTIDSETVAGSAIAVVNLVTPGVPATLLTEFDRFADSPDWHPAEDLIVFQLASPPSGDGPYDLYTMDSAGHGLGRLTTFGGSGHQAIQARWAPDGQSIVFVYDQMWSNPHLGEVLADGTLLTFGDGPTPMMTHPRLQPGG